MNLYVCIHPYWTQNKNSPTVTQVTRSEGVLGPTGAVTSSFQRVLGPQVSLAYSPGSPVSKPREGSLSLKLRAFICQPALLGSPSVLAKCFSPYSKGQLLQHWGWEWVLVLFLSSSALSCPKPGEGSSELSRLSSWGTGPHLHACQKASTVWAKLRARRPGGSGAWEATAGPHSTDPWPTSRAPFCSRSSLKSIN